MDIGEQLLRQYTGQDPDVETGRINIIKILREVWIDRSLKAREVEEDRFRIERFEPKRLKIDGDDVDRDFYLQQIYDLLPEAGQILLNEELRSRLNQDDRIRGLNNWLGELAEMILFVTDRDLTNIVTFSKVFFNQGFRLMSLLVKPLELARGYKKLTENLTADPEQVVLMSIFESTPQIIVPLLMLTQLSSQDTKKDGRISEIKAESVWGAIQDLSKDDLVESIEYWNQTYAKA
jgi:hypothetical protein